MYADKGLINFVSSFKTFALEDDKNVDTTMWSHSQGLDNKHRAWGDSVAKFCPQAP